MAQSDKPSLSQPSFWAYSVILAGILVVSVWMMFLRSEEKLTVETSPAATTQTEPPQTEPLSDSDLLATLGNFGTLVDFEPLDQRVEQRSAEDITGGGGQTTVVDDLVVIKIKAAVAQSGQVFYDSANAGGPDGSLVLGVAELCYHWQDGLVDMAAGGRRRLLLPASEVNQCLFANPQGWPSDHDAVADVELVRLVERTSIGSDAPLTDFTPLVELLDSLRFEDIEPGQGQAIASGETFVVVNYTGVLAESGQIFDSNKAQGFLLNGVIEGWRQGLIGMKEGGIRRIFIPSAAGYGQAGFGSDIPPNADLVFDVQLIIVINPDNQAA